MKVKYRKGKTIITLGNKKERISVFRALRFYEIKHRACDEHETKIVSELLDEWMREARTMKD